MTNNILNKALPCHIESEQALLSSMINDPNSITEIPEIKEEMFYKTIHKKIFETTIRLWRMDVDIDLVQIVVELKNTEDRLYVNELADVVISGYNIKKYAKKVIDSYYARENILVLKRGIEQLYDTSVDYAKTLNDVQKSVKVNDVNDEYFFVEDVYDEVVSDIEAVKNGEKEVELFTTGLNEIDRVVKLKRGALLVIGARPSHGKSVFAKVMSLANVEQDKTVAVFNMEMKAKEQVERIIPDLANVNYSSMVDKRYINRDSLEEIKLSKSKIKKRRLIFTNVFSLDFQKIRSMARSIKAKHGLDMIVVDYLQLMEESKDGKKKSRTDEVGEMSRLGKVIANELDILVVVLSQLNRKCEDRNGENKIPISADLRDSGRIEQDADHVLLLAIPLKFGLKSLGGEEMTRNTLITRCTKNRNSTTYNMKSHYFDGEAMTIKDETRF